MARRHRLLLVAAATLAFVTPLAAQRAAPSGVPAAGVLTAERTAEEYRVTFFNRDIIVLRARVAGRSPAERGVGAVNVLDGLTHDRATGPVETREVGGGTLVTVAGRGVLLVTPTDIDELSGETVDEVTAQAVAQLRRALAEADEARAPAILLRATIASLLVIAIAAAAVWGVAVLRRRVAARLVAAAERRIAASGIVPLEAMRAARIGEVERYLTTALLTLIDLIVLYATIGFVLREFPYTRPWGESMRGFLIATVENLTLGAAHAIPGLFTVVLIFGVTRLVVRLLSVWFHAVEQGQLQTSWLYPETAQPTRRLVAALLWVFAVIVAYPYMPGSQTEAFKGVGVFFGLMLTFGSSGLVSQIMSGFMITYSRAVRVGDFVRIGDIEGTVTHVGVLSTKITSPLDEAITIPNAVVVAQTTTDYSRHGGVFTPTSVTIGYDTPWRQIHAMLVRAAERTDGIRSEPAPMVLQAGLEDFYVKYTLWVCLERQHNRPFVLASLHANIQDVFNEYGVQIMSPNYVLDPAAPKLVPKDQWFAAPADMGTVHSTNAAVSSGAGRPAE